jgi:hypothetical protein
MGELKSMGKCSIWEFGGLRALEVREKKEERNREGRNEEEMKRNGDEEEKKRRSADEEERMESS